MAVDSISDGARLLARGVEITLKDGAHRVILDYEALEALEERFGGLDEFVAHLQEESWKGARLQTVRFGLAAGLLHEKPVDESLEGFQVRVRNLLSARDLIAYLEALLIAIQESLPAVAPNKAPKA